MQADRTTCQQPSCFKTFKGERGLRIHLGIIKKCGHWYERLRRKKSPLDELSGSDAELSSSASVNTSSTTTGRSFKFPWSSAPKRDPARFTIRQESHFLGLPNAGNIAPIRRNLHQFLMNSRLLRISTSIPPRPTRQMITSWTFLARILARIILKFYMHRLRRIVLILSRELQLYSKIVSRSWIRSKMIGLRWKMNAGFFTLSKASRTSLWPPGFQIRVHRCPTSINFLQLPIVS